jgi:hypothetical protein
MSIIEGHILKIIRITECKNKTDFCVILSVINNYNKFTIKGFINIRPIEDNFIKASNFKEIFLQSAVRWTYKQCASIASF